MIPAARPARPSRRPLRKPRRGPTLGMRDQRANDFVQVTWETPNGLENSKNRRSAGGHGNQHVRLRSAQVGRSRRSARPVATVSGRGRRPLCFGFAEIRRGAQRPAQNPEDICEAQYGPHPDIFMVSNIFQPQSVLHARTRSTVPVGLPVLHGVLKRPAAASVADMLLLDS